MAGRLASNVAALSIGQVAARVLSIVYIAALARHVQSEGMGQLATAQSLAAVLAMCLGLGHETLAVREIAAKPGEATFWLWDLISLRVVLSMVGLAALAVFGYAVGYARDTTEVVVVYGLVMAVYALLSVVRSILQAHERLKLDAGIQFGHDVVNIVLSLVAIFLGAPLLTIVWISVAANLGQLVLELAAVGRLGLVGLARPSLQRCGAILRRGLGIGLVVIFSILYTQAGTILLSLTAGVTATGIYSVANNLLLVLLILPDTFQRAVLPVYSRMHAGDVSQLRTTYEQSIRVLIAVGLPIAVGTYLVADSAIQLLYGDGFRDAAQPLRVLALALIAAPGYASAAVLLATGRQRLLAAGALIELLAQVGLALVLVPLFGATGAAVAYTIPRLVSCAVYAVVCHRALALRLPIETLAISATSTLVMGGVVATALQAGAQWLFLVCLVGPVTYVGCFLLMGGVRGEELHIKHSLQEFVTAAARHRALQRLMVPATLALSAARVIRPQTAQTIVRLADASTGDLIVRRRVKFGDGCAPLRLELPARYHAALRVAFEDVYRHPTEGVSLGVFSSLAREAECICDVGAHVGLYTYLATTQARQSARIFAFEPLPDLSQSIRRNVALNRLSQVRVVSAAVGREPGRAELCVPFDTQYASLQRGWLTQHGIASFSAVEVDVIALDSFFQRQGPPSPDLLKIDVEGYEQQVLAGMSGILEANRPDMILELIGAERSRAIIDMLASRWGYRVFFIGDGLRELGLREAPPSGELHNFLVTCRPAADLRARLQLGVVEAGAGVR